MSSGASVRPNAATRRRMSVRRPRRSARCRSRRASDGRAAAARRIPRPSRNGDPARTAPIRRVLDLGRGVARASRGAARRRRAAARDTARRCVADDARAARRWRRAIDSSRAQRIDLARVQVGGHPARQPGGPAGHLRRDVRVAVAIAADPRAEAHRRGVERQRLARARDRSAAGSAAARPTASARTPRARRALRRAATTARRALPRSATRSAISRRSASIAASDSSGVRSGRSRTASSVGDAAMLLQQRAADHLGRVRREHQLDPQRSHRVGERVGRQARRRASARTPRRTNRAAAGAPDRARSRGAGGRGDAARRCSPASGSARTRARSAPPTPAAARAADRPARRTRVGSPPCARFASARTSSTSSNSAVAFKRAERLAEQLAEQPDVVAQWLVGIIHDRQHRLRRRSRESGRDRARFAGGDLIRSSRCDDPAALVAGAGTNVDVHVPRARERRRHVRPSPIFA